MEREFMVRVDGEQLYVRTREEIVLGAKVEAYCLVGSKRRASLFRGPPENDAALIEKLSLGLGRFKRDLVVTGAMCANPDAHQLFLVRVANSVRHPVWRAGSWVRFATTNHFDQLFETCRLSEARIFTTQQLAEQAIRGNEKNFDVKFEIVPFAEVFVPRGG